MNSNRPSVSRDTRLLLAIVLVSIGILWVLARLRFPDRVPTPNPVPPVLAQLTTPSPLEDIAASVAQLQPRLEPLIAAVNVQSPQQGASGAGTRTISALRFRDDLAMALIPGGDPADSRVVGASEVARDPVSQLAVIRLANGSAPLLSTWTPRRLLSPRMMIAAAGWREGATLRPVFVASLNAATSPTWSGAIWTMPPPVDLEPGTFVFTVDGAFAGLAIGRGTQRAMVPADTVLGIADRLTRGAPQPRGRLGIEIQPLTSALAAAAGVNTGVIVSWVDPSGPAAGLVEAADVVDRIGDENVATAEDWQALTARLAANESVVLGVRRQRDARDVRLTASAAAPSSPASQDRSPGLTLRTDPRIGAVIVRVDADSPAARAGLQSGDVLTLVGDIQTPTAAQVTRALAAAARERPILLGVMRGSSHRLVALERTW